MPGVWAIIQGELTMNSCSGVDSARARVSELIEGFWPTKVVGLMVSLGLPDLMAAGPCTYDYLAASANVDPQSLLRLLKALQTLGLCTRPAEDLFELTPEGHLLRADVPASMQGRASFVSGVYWTLFSDLEAVVKAGRPTSTVPTGRDGFNRLRDHPNLAGMHKAMVESSLQAALDASQAYDFGRFGSILDVGGGYGGALGKMLGIYPSLVGAVLDLPYLQNEAERYLEGTGASSRSRYIPGDFFDEVPPGFDCYFLKYIIHDWPDTEAVKILRNCGKAAGRNGVVILLERIMPEVLENTGAHRAIMQIDLAMMAVGGKERTADEYRQLLAQAGLTLRSVTPTQSVYSLIEAAPL